MHKSGGGDGEDAGELRGELMSLKTLLSSEAIVKMMTMSNQERKSGKSEQR